jgi:uncharacterized protein (DUF362 family)
MNERITRRQALRCGAAAVGWASARTILPTAAGRAAQTTKEPAASLPVAIGRCASYQPDTVFNQLKHALDLLGGIQDLVRDKTVTVKLNLTGGPQWKLGGLPSYRTYHVHPHFVAAACAIFQQAGARRIVLVESSYARQSLEEIMTAGGWDLAQIQRAAGGKVVWEDTRNQGRWPNYSRLQVPWGGYLYPAFDLNSRYEKTDVFVSLAKLKDHANAGITVSVKNLFGIAPTSIYGDNYDDAGRPKVEETCVSARGETLHRGIRQPPAGAPQEVDPESSRHWSYRVPRATADLFGARPVDLCLVDGIESNRGGEGPWIQGVEPIKPELIIAGRNGVCTDAICCAVMGYDPTADHKQFPFMGDNHLALLAEKGVGTNVVEDIETRGLAVKDALHPFNPRRLQVGKPLFS